MRLGLRCLCFLCLEQGEAISLAQVDKMDLQYTYLEGDVYHFMDTNTFEEVSIDASVVGDKSGFMMEGMNLSVSLTVCDWTVAAEGGHESCCQDALIAVLDRFVD